MRLVKTEQEFQNAWDSTASQAPLSNDDIYLEKFIEEQDILDQIIGDATGKACHLSERVAPFKASKTLEETPSPIITRNFEEYETAIKEQRPLNMKPVQSILVDKYGKFYFMDEYPYQVEHPITEEVTDYV